MVTIFYHPERQIASFVIGKLAHDALPFTSLAGLCAWLEVPYIKTNWKKKGKRWEASFTLTPQGAAT